MPSESPLRLEDWFTHNALVEANHRVGLLSLEHNVDIGYATGADCLKIYFTIFRNIVNDPILWSSVLIENPNPMRGLMLIHEEGVGSKALAAGLGTIILDR